MKNSILFLILIFLLGITYVLQEYLPPKDLLEQQNMSRAIWTENLTKVNLPNFTVLKEEKGFHIQGHLFPVSSQKLEKLVAAFAAIHVVKKIPVDIEDSSKMEEFLGKNPLSFSIETDNEVTKYQLGESPSVTGNFYLLREKYYSKELLLCSDESVAEHIYRTDNELQLKKFYSFYQKINSKPVDFMNRKIFEWLIHQPLEEVEFNNTRNRFFSVNFKTKETSPKPLDGIQYNERFFNEFLKQLVGLEFSQIHERGKKLENEIASIKLSADNKISLFQKYGDKTGHFISYPKSAFIYEVQTFEGNIFFQHVQAFWLKNLAFTQKVKTLDGLSFDMTFFDSKKNKKFTVLVQDKELFQITVKDRPHWIVDDKKITSLLKIFFGLEGYAQASMVEEYTEQFKLENENAREFRIEILGKKLDFYQKNLEIVVANLTERYILHYPNLDKMNFGNIPKAFFNNSGEP